MRTLITVDKTAAIMAGREHYGYTEVRIDLECFSLEERAVLGCVHMGQMGILGHALEEIKCKSKFIKNYTKP